MMRLRSQNGYIFLVSVIVIGAIAVASTLSLLLLGWAAEQNGQTHVRTNQALELANTCADRALMGLRDSVTYAGNQDVVLAYGTCKIYPAVGANNKRTICVEGTDTNTTRRLHITLSAIFPTVTVSKWDEVGCFTDCGTGNSVCTGG